MTRVTAFAAATAVAVVAVLVVVLSTRGTPLAPVHRPVTARDGAAVRVADTRLGRILVDARGHTLYLFLDDRGGRSACGTRCARVWPPLIASSRPDAGRGVIGRKLGTTRRADGRLQVVYNGHPLYTLTADNRAGQTRGQGFLRAWYVVSPAGHAIGARRGSRPASY